MILEDTFLPDSCRVSKTNLDNHLHTNAGSSEESKSLGTGSSPIDLKSIHPVKFLNAH